MSTDLVVKEDKPEPQPHVRLDQLTVVEHIYHQSADGSIEETASTYYKKLKMVEQVYRRRTIIKSEWKLLDCGWIGDQTCLLHISNEEGKNLQRALSVDEQIDLAMQALEVSYDKVNSFLIHPTETMKVCPSQATKLWIRCKNGQALAIITMLPE